MDLQVERWKTLPFQHQVDGVEFLLRKPAAALFDEMGSGKTHQVVNAACLLFPQRQIDTVVVMAPSAVKHGWKDLGFGEIVKHVWVDSWIGEFASRHTKIMPYDDKTRSRLYWLVTNYEFIRQENRLAQLMQQLRGRRILAVADEGAFIKSHKAAQTAAALQVRTLARRAILLNGSPIGNNIMDLYSQMQFLDPRILGYKNWFHMRGVHCNLGGWNKKQIVGYKNLPLLMNKIRPYVLRRLKKDCLDLPDKLYSVVQVPLSDDTWRAYAQMRDRMVTYIKGIGTAMTMHSIVKIMRLAQITNGFIGGIEDGEPGEVHVISREKVDALLDLLKVKVAEDPNFRVVIWTRFRAEQERLAKELKVGGFGVYRIYGGQKESERNEAIRVFTEGGVDGPLALLGQPQAGGFGLNLVAASYCVYMSNDYNLLTRLQSEDRQHREGQRHHVLYNDVLATGPKGQQTIDHIIYAALRRKEDFAKWTTDHWVTKLTAEKTVSLDDLLREQILAASPF